MRNYRKIKLDSSGIKLENKDDIQMYVYGGKGRFILKSNKSNKSYEFKIKKPAKTVFEGYKKVPNPRYSDNILFVFSRINDNVDFQYIGVYRIEENIFNFSKKSKIDITHDTVKGFKWLIKQFENDKDFPSEMEFFHMGICGCCAKTLTTPQSIKMGIGPICFEKFGNIRLKKLMELQKRIKRKMNK